MRAFAQLHVVYLLHLFLNQHTLLTVTFSLINNHLDYCNKPYMELPLKSIQNFHLAQCSDLHNFGQAQMYTYATSFDGVASVANLFLGGIQDADHHL